MAKPTALKVLEGNRGKRPLNKKEPKPTPTAPAVPDWIASNPIALAEWQRIVPELDRIGMLTQIDGGALEAYVKAYSRWRAAEEYLDSIQTTTIEMGKQNYITVHPQVTVAQRYMKLMLSFMQGFGLTPNSRGRMQLPGQSDDDEEMKALICLTNRKQK